MKKEIIIDLVKKCVTFSATDVANEFVEYIKSKFNTAQCVVTDNVVELIGLAEDMIKLIAAYAVDKEKEGFVVIAK